MAVSSNSSSGLGAPRTPGAKCAIDVQVMFRGRGEPVCSPNRGADESGSAQITVLSLNICGTP